MSEKENASNTDQAGQSAEPPEKQAIALQYDAKDADAAPVVTASGKGFLADRILEEATKAGIEVRQDADLVEMLAATEVGQEIPVEAFVAVAEILRYVYEKNGAAPGGLKK